MNAREEREALESTSNLSSALEKPWSGERQRWVGPFSTSKVAADPNPEKTRSVEAFVQKKSTEMVGFVVLERDKREKSLRQFLTYRFLWKTFSVHSNYALF